MSVGDWVGLVIVGFVVVFIICFIFAMMNADR